MWDVPWGFKSTHRFIMPASAGCLWLSADLRAGSVEIGAPSRPHHGICVVPTEAPKSAGPVSPAWVVIRRRKSVRLSRVAIQVSAL